MSRISLLLQESKVKPGMNINNRDGQIPVSVSVSVPIPVIIRNIDFGNLA